jgi:hypothetical protein
MATATRQGDAQVLPRQSADSAGTEVPVRTAPLLRRHCSVLLRSREDDSDRHIVQQGYIVAMGYWAVHGTSCIYQDISAEHQTAFWAPRVGCTIDTVATGSQQRQGHLMS